MVVSANTLGRYQIVREIARSNDIVYEAVDQSINRRVALKELLLPPNLAGAQRTERIQRFYREARAAGSLSHPNIVTIYEVGEDHGRHFIAMEYLEGQTLRDVLEIEGKLPVERAVEIVKQVCDALAYAHSNGVIHRDVKPDNIQILPSGLIKITDFGIARIMEEPSLTADGQVFGTPSYMSPEQVAGKPLDCRTDLFSLGIVLFEMLTGRKPFIGDSVVTITYNIMNQEIAVPPTAPPYLERVLRRSMSKDPNLRYQSAAEMAADLDPSTFAGVQPDAFGATVSMPGPVFAPQSPQPQAGGSGDPYSISGPSDLSLPRRRSKPILSAEAKYFLKVLFAVILACGILVAFVWAFNAAYQRYQEMARQEEVSAHLEAGKRHFESQSYRTAIEEFNQVLKLSTDPDVIRIAKHDIATSYLELGIGADQAGNPFQAVAHFRQALVYDDEYAEAYLLLGNSLRRMQRSDEALSAWAKATQVEPGSKAATAARRSMAVVYHERGDEALRAGNSDTAVQWWQKAMETAPGTEEGFLAQRKIETVTGVRGQD